MEGNGRGPPPGSLCHHSPQIREGNFILKRLIFVSETKIIATETVFTVKDKDDLSHLDCTSETQIMVGEDALRSARFRQITATIYSSFKGTVHQTILHIIGRSCLTFYLRYCKFLSRFDCIRKSSSFFGILLRFLYRLSQACIRWRRQIRAVCFGSTVGSMEFGFRIRPPTPLWIGCFRRTCTCVIFINKLISARTFQFLAAKKTWVWIFNPHQASNLDLDGLKNPDPPHHIFNFMLIQIIRLVSAGFIATATLSGTFYSSRIQIAAGDNSSGRMLNNYVP